MTSLCNCDLPVSSARDYVWEASASENAWLHVSAGLGTSLTLRCVIATRPRTSILTELGNGADSRPSRTNFAHRLWTAISNGLVWQR